MPRLQDYFASDLNVFLNTDEFAEVHNIDGIDLPAVIDSDEMKTYSNNKSEQYDGIYAGRLVVYVEAAGLPDRPVFDQQIRLDGSLYLVVECTEDNGILKIVLEANES